MLEILLAVLSGSAAVGMRIALPLLVIAMFSENLWASMPGLSVIAPPIALGILAGWSVLELVASKDRFGQRLLQVLEKESYIHELIIDFRDAAHAERLKKALEANKAK